MSEQEQLRLQFDRWQRSALIAGVLGLLLCAAGSWSHPEQFFRSYLIGFLFWMGIPLGSVAIALLHHLSGGGWGVPVRRMLEAATRTFPLMAVIFIPVLVGIPRLYAWARPEAANDAVVRLKLPYLNPQFFVARCVIYFVVWIVLAWLLNKWSFEQDRTASPRMASRLEALGGPGLILYGITVTFAAVDWVMSLEPTWSSTIYGLIFMVVQAIQALAFAVLVARLLARYEPLAGVVKPQQFNDLGNLLLAFVMLWAYLGFAQFLIIWSGNLKDEITWFSSRASGGWAALAVILILFHFAVPFLLLLIRDLKRKMHVLARIAGLLLVVSLLDVYWLVAPAFEAHGPRIHPTNVLAVVGIGGLWLAGFIRELKGRPLVALHDPNLEGAMQHAD